MTNGAWACDLYSRPGTCRTENRWRPSQWCPACKTNPSKVKKVLKLHYKLIEDGVWAVQVTKENVEEVAVWCGGQVVQETSAINETEKFVGINVPTLNGNERASERDFILENSRGEKSVKKAAEFLRNYEEA